MNFKTSIAMSPRFHAMIPPMLIVCFAIYLLVIYDHNKTISLLLVVFMLGSAGGITSTYMRFKDLPSNIFDLNDSSNNRIMAIVQIYASPIIAGIFGWLCYSLFLSGAIKGSLFPEFIGTDDNYDNIRQLFLGIKPKTLKDATLALLWAYIAGFSEKMIPNILDRLTNKYQEENKPQ